MTTSTLAGTLVPLTMDKPGTMSKASLYNTKPTMLLTGPYFPVNDTVVVDNNVLYVVKNADPINFTFDLMPAFLSSDADADGLTSVVSYGNDIFRALYDNRTSPCTLNIDNTLKFVGGSPSRYQIYRYYNTDQAVVISQSYDSLTGKFINSSGTISATSDNSNIFYCNPCYITQVPDDDEALQLIAYNEAGSEVASVRLSAKEGQILNDLSTYQPKIVSLTFTSTQMLASGACYLYEKQDKSALGLQAILTYQDGRTIEVPIDDRQCYLYGYDDLVAAYAGLKQQLMLKYFLSLDEVTATTQTQGDGSISCTFNVIVVPNQLAAPVKISTIPSWNSATNQYELRYYYYTTAGTIVKDVTSMVSITSGTFQPTQYMTEQSFQIGCDLSKVDPTTYPTSTTYIQNVAIRLRPVSTLVRWTIRDALTSPYIYGMDSTSDRRPLLFFDDSLKQHFISTALFTTQAAFLKSYFTDANPPYDSDVDIQAITPTHFVIRDPVKGVLITPDAVAIEDYAAAMSLVISADPTGYVGGTLMIEFIKRVANTNDVIIYGVPVDVYAGTYAAIK